MSIHSSRVLLQGCISSTQPWPRGVPSGMHAVGSSDPCIAEGLTMAAGTRWHLPGGLGAGIHCGMGCLNASHGPLAPAGDQRYAAGGNASSSEERLSLLAAVGGTLHTAPWASTASPTFRKAAMFAPADSTQCYLSTGGKCGTVRGRRQRRRAAPPTARCSGKASEPASRRQPACVRSVAQPRS